jgi:hypothetical protein
MFGFVHHVTNFQPQSSEESQKTCEGLDKNIPQGIPEADRTEEECPPFKNMQCPPGHCGKPHDYMFCRGVNTAVCFINEFQNFFLNVATDVYDDASLARNVGRVGHQEGQGMLWSKWKELKPESLDAGVFGDFMFSTHAINDGLAYGDAGVGIFINSLKLIDLICYDRGSDCTRTKHMVSIAVGITSFALSLTGVGIPFHFLLNGLTSVLVGKLGPMICEHGVKETFRKFLFCPSLQLMQDIGKEIKNKIKEYIEYLDSWQKAIATMMLTPLIILGQILKLVGKLILKLAWGIAKMVRRLPKTLIASMMAVKAVANGESMTQQEIIKKEEKDHFCCALKAVKDTEEVMEDETEPEFVELKEEALQKEEETGDEPLYERLKQITFGPGEGLDEVENEQVVEDQLDAARLKESKTEFDVLMKEVQERPKPPPSEPAYCKVVA